MTAFLVVGAALVVTFAALFAVVSAVYAIVRGLWSTTQILLELRRSRKDLATARARDHWRNSLKGHW